MKSFVSLCADETSILDDFSPYVWQGPGACARWWIDNDAFGKTNEITDAFVTLGKPLALYVTGDYAYVATRDDFDYKVKGQPMKQAGSIRTIVLRKTSSGWRISAEAWAATALAAPVKTGP